MLSRKFAPGLSPRRVAALVALLTACCCRSVAPQESPTGRKLLTFGGERVVPFVPTPLAVVNRMLKLAKVDRDDVVYDLGSGDGRIVIMAAQKFGAQAVGVELDDELFKKSSERISQLGLQKRAKILHGNMFETDLRHATVVTLYLLTSVNEQMRPLLEKQLRHGARVVCHDFHVRGWEAEKVEKVTSENGIEHTIYLYVRP